MRECISAEKLRGCHFNYVWHTAESATNVLFTNLLVDLTLQPVGLTGFVTH